MSTELNERNEQLRQKLWEKEETERALRLNDVRLDKAQQLARLGSWDWDMVRNAASWSGGLLNILGVDAATFIPTRNAFLEFVHAADREMVENWFNHALAGEPQATIDYRVVLPDGTVKHVLSQIEIEFDDGGRPLMLFGTVLDITARKQVEDALHREKADQAALIKRLEEAHNQLLQSEKMASIGQLAAGVAHEINNPIGFVSANLGSLGKYVEQLFAVLAAYEAVRVQLPADSQAVADVAAAEKEADLAYLKEDIPALLKESLDGITRVRRIVQDLKDFSHVDSGEWQWADLHQGLDSTLNVVNNEIKYKAEVVKEYGDLPRVECLGSQINQVFMNLLVNAAHAIQERGVITVRTGSAGEEVWVEVADTGSGIPPDNLKRIFDPFFTTKPIGKGTGLGLSLSYGIVQKHHGRIEVSSELGKGTTFRVTLPVHCQEPKADN
ncbi:MAG: PAS domain-containing protein [Gammaproteobacteria bacterium]|nr:PAS domain-containing protein [Gammaproteobacteria bacterium]MBU1646098.1 PAS domain-containing protein [Gammaproteobacteria bacterium]MBU1972160.1 PAS domain-containing protein [Gammaproteobacteria bacterium]